jgi:hypothetical protein
MKFIRPTPIATAMLISSTAPETDYAAWASGTTYAQYAKCILTSTHRIYESTQAANTSNDPATDDGTWWIDIRPTNRWAMFDQSVGTVTSIATPLTVVLAPGVVVNSLALLDISGTSVTVGMLDSAGGASVYNKTYTLADAAEVIDWYGYFFEPIQSQDTLLIYDLPPYPSGRITVTLNASTTASCGTLAVGNLIDIGKTRYGAGIGIVDYSKKDVDIFGVTSVLERAYAKMIETSMLVNNGRLNYISKQLAAVRAIPCVWVGDNDAGYSALTAYGFYKDWSVNIAYPNYSECSLTIEGLT